MNMKWPVDERTWAFCVPWLRSHRVCCAKLVQFPIIKWHFIVDKIREASTNERSKATDCYFHAHAIPSAVCAAVVIVAMLAARSNYILIAFFFGRRSRSVGIKCWYCCHGSQQCVNSNYMQNGVCHCLCRRCQCQCFRMHTGTNTQTGPCQMQLDQHSHTPTHIRARKWEYTKQTN